MVRSPRWPGESGSTQPTDGAVLTPIAFVRMLVRRWRLVLFLPLVAAVGAVLVSILFRDYTARSRFVPHSSNGDISQFAGIAAQIGVPLGMEATGESPDFYVDLIGSGEVLGPAVDAEYRFAARTGARDSLRGTWLDLLGIEGDSPEERRRNGIDALRQRVSASANVKSGIVTVRTTAPWPGLAEAVNARVLVLLSQFDRERRQSGAQAEREFVEGRLASAKSDLESAERALATFLDRNKRPESPRLMMQLEQLQREVGLRQQLYSVLAQAYEQARIEEVRNTPVITIVDRPEGTARGGRGALVTALLAFALGLIAAVGLAFLLDWFAQRADSPEMNELRASIRPRRRVAAGDAG